MSDEANNDELVSQFLAFTGSVDVERATSYLEMSGGDLETAVGLFMEHTTGGGGGAAGAPTAPDIRAPDETRTMRLMDHDGPPAAAGLLQHLMEQASDDHLMESASAFSRSVDPRAAVNAAAAAAAALQGSDDDDDDDMAPQPDTPSLGDLFAPPTHLMFKGNFQGARSVAKDARRWLLVNLQRDSEFSSHALNRDVWRDELVENLIREGFIFWQTMDTTQDGQTYSQHYSVGDYPHVSIIDPRTGRLMWRKEGWTQEHPLTKQDFCQLAMDFCSRHSFDKPPTAAGSMNKKRHLDDDEAELQAVLQASMKDDNNSQDDDDDDEVQVYSDEEEEEEVKPPSMIDELLQVDVGDEPSSGARIQIRMPNAKKLVRKFDSSQNVKIIYAFVAQSNPDSEKEFSLFTGFPPKNLADEMNNTIESCGLAGQAITVRWKEE